MVYKPPNLSGGPHSGTFPNGSSWICFVNFHGALMEVSGHSMEDKLLGGTVEVTYGSVRR